MKKLLILFVCLLAGGLVWFLWPEYGSGYSEEQRRLWNERRALYPVEWMVHSLFPDKDISNLLYEIGPLCAKNDGNLTAIIKEKGKQEEILAGQLERNRDQAGAEYEAVLSSPADVSRLPLEELTEKETAERALAGDSDACLKMVQYVCGGYGRCEPCPIAYLSWRQQREAEKWLDRAIALKRPGSVFLKLAFQDRLARDKNDCFSLKLPVAFSCKEKCLGYADYLECLKKGDYLLYETLAGTTGCFSSDEDYRLLYEALLKEAKSGRTDAWRKLASLYFIVLARKGTFVARYHISNDIMQQHGKWSDRMKWLPKNVKALIMEGVISCSVIQADKGPTMKIYRESARYARKAARMGDLTGMYLWMEYAVMSYERFSKEDWKDIFAYDRALLEAGYAPYLETKRRGGMGMLSEAVLQSFYSEKSYEKIKGQNCMPRRGWICREPGGIAGGMICQDDLAATRELVENRRLTGQTDDLLECLMRWQGDGTFIQAGEEVRAYLLEQVEAWAGEGDLFAMYVLAEFCEEGWFMKCDPGRAYELYEKVFSGAREYPVFRVPVCTEECEPSGSPGKDRLLYAALLGMAKTVLNHAEFSGQRGKETCETLLNFNSRYTNGCYHYYYLGQFYERGIGCTQDREKALEFYKKASSKSEACRKAAERLSSVLEGEGKIQKEKD